MFCQMKNSGSIAMWKIDGLDFEYEIAICTSSKWKRKKTHTCIVAYFSGDKFSTDWDKAWSSFRKQGKKRLFSQFSPDKYVTWNPRRSNYPLSEEVDPIKRTERSNLMLWTSPGFTLTVAIIIVTFLLIYTILAPVK
ncbi:hypothetical protein CK203_086012 [Vitis vinifera]|uniref:Uncharacterized protein n=1 Tax=Vitis vinifera TaxID=29760 RepID=A0A438DW33_VITVI|nr:hypothetical protein CK203_086012 [Vitis vinifera]